MNSNNSKKTVLTVAGIIVGIALVALFIWYISTISINLKNVYNGLKISGIGLAGVFVVLIIFYASTKLMMYISNKYSKPDKTNS
ncbi:OadG family protein [Acetivibrio cellulolyticus]|uniref:OadG family protein n=1 Tax=Acetivibrio cellulolyticus TaxID=35830 RepID=UPI0001E2BDD8|nr:OadG family protein [Acetivibrio cellulolyticus]